MVCQTGPKLFQIFFFKSDFLYSHIPIRFLDKLIYFWTTLGKWFPRYGRSVLKQKQGFVSELSVFSARIQEFGMKIDLTYLLDCCLLLAISDELSTSQCQ
jgi:hypothetical protein